MSIIGLAFNKDIIVKRIIDSKPDIIFLEGCSNNPFLQECFDIILKGYTSSFSRKAYFNLCLVCKRFMAVLQNIYFALHSNWMKSCDFKNSNSFYSVYKISVEVDDQCKKREELRSIPHWELMTSVTFQKQTP